MLACALPHSVLLPSATVMTCTNSSREMTPSSLTSASSIISLMSFMVKATPGNSSEMAVKSSIESMKPDLSVSIF